MVLDLPRHCTCDSGLDRISGLVHICWREVPIILLRRFRPDPIIKMINSFHRLSARSQSKVQWYKPEFSGLLVSMSDCCDPSLSIFRKNKDMNTYRTISRGLMRKKRGYRAQNCTFPVKKFILIFRYYPNLIRIFRGNRRIELNRDGFIMSDGILSSLGLVDLVKLVGLTLITKMLTLTRKIYMLSSVV